MSKLVNTRVIEICPGEYVAQFLGGLGRWQTFSDTFETEQEARVWLDDQIDNADWGDEE